MSCRLTSITVAAAALAIAASGAGAGSSIDFDVVITADNRYDLYTGDFSSVDTHVGGAFATLAAHIFSAESYSLTLPENGYLYIVTWSDVAVYQGVLAEFTSNLGTIYSGSQWEVFAVGDRPAVAAPARTLADVTAQIMIANSGGGPSNGWVPATGGMANNSSSLWGGQIPAINPAADWMWYDSGRDPRSNAPFLGFDHDEYLIFRLPVNIPTPGSLALMGLAAPIALRRRRN